MITYVILEMIDSIAEQFKDMKSNIVNIQEKDNNSEHKRGFWDNVLMMLISVWMIVLTIATIFVITYSLVTSIGLKALLPIIMVVMMEYIITKTEVFYKLLYKLFKKSDKENGN